MYTKTDKTIINQFFNILKTNENQLENFTFEFSDNGLFQFENSSYIAFKKLNSYIDKISNYLIHIENESILKIYSETEKYCFAIKARILDTFEVKTDLQIFTDSIFKKYSKHFEKPNELKYFQKNNNCFLFNGELILKLNETFNTDFNGETCTDNHINLITNIFFAEYSHYFNFPKSIGYDNVNTNIDLENGIIYNSIGDKIKLKTSETLKDILIFRHSNKVFKLCLSEKILLNKREFSGSYYFRIEKKNFIALGLINK